MYDSSTMKDFMVCPRMYYFKNILHWRSNSPRIDAMFGSGIHKSAEVFLLGKRKKYNFRKIYEGLGKDELYYIEQLYDNIPVLQRGLEAFDSEFTVDEYDYNTVKNRERAWLFLPLLHDYTQELMERYSLVMYGDVPLIEAGGQILLNLNQDELSFRMDAVLRNDRKYICYDFKTSSSGFDFASRWEHEFQVLTYTYAMLMVFGENSFDCVKIGGLIFKKTKIENGRTPPLGHFDIIEVDITPSFGEVKEWWTQANLIVKEIQDNKQRLTLDLEKPIMESFRKNYNVCHFQFGKRCDYLDLCQLWQNPVRESHTPPIGFIVEEWNPIQPKVKIGDANGKC